MIFAVIIMLVALNASLAHTLDLSGTRNATEIEESPVCCSKNYSNIVSDYISEMVKYSINSVRSGIAIIGENSLDASNFNNDLLSPLGLTIVPKASCRNVDK